MHPDIPKKVKLLIREIEPSVEIFLYGSRVGKETDSGQTWDFLVLVDGPVTSERADRIRHSLYSLEMESGGKIAVVVKDRQEWNSPDNKNVPLYKRIQNEGIAL